MKQEHDTQIIYLDDTPCADCKFWKQGECRRHAPIPASGKDLWGRAVWPTTAETDSCGDWQWNGV